jgi:hypothetical protein
VKFELDVSAHAILKRQGVNLKSCKNRRKKNSALNFVADKKIDYIDQRQQQQINATNHVQHDKLTPVQEFCILCVYPDSLLAHLITLAFKLQHQYTSFLVIGDSVPFFSAR